MFDSFIRKEIIAQISPDAKKDGVSIIFKTSSAGAKIKFDTEFITVIASFLSNKISSQYKDSIYYAIEGGIDSSNELDSSILVIYIKENSDFDVDSIYLAAKNLVLKCLNNLIDISKNNIENVHRVKIILGGQQINASPANLVVDSEDEVFLTQSLISNVLGRSKYNCTISFKIDDEYFDLSLRRSSNAPIESETNNQISCMVLCVDDHGGYVIVRGKDIKGMKKYNFEPQQRHHLLEAQLAGNELIINIIPMEKFNQGELLECGGRIINIKVIEHERLI